MRKWTALWIIFVVAAMCGRVNADAVNCEIEVTKQKAFTVDDCEKLKLLMPKYRDWINSYAVALKEGMAYSYKVNIWLNQVDEPIHAAFVVKPNKEVVTLKKDGPGSFASETGGPGTFYTSIPDLAAGWPSGEYQLHVTFSDRHTRILTASIPDYDATPFPSPVSGTLSANSQGELVLDWSTVPCDDEFEVWCFELKKMRDVFESEDWHFSHPNEYRTLIEGARAGKGDYQVGVDAEMNVAWGEFAVEFNSEASWCSFRKPLPAYEDKATKCTVYAKKDNTSSLSLSGQLTAIEADFLLADRVHVAMSCATGLDPIVLEFPIDAKTLKNGKFYGTIKDPDAKTTASFRYDTTTHAFTFALTGFDLTGLSCPFTVAIEVGAYYDAAIELEEDIVNTTKACPPQLIRGLVDSLVVEKSLLRAGKLVGLDTFSASGVFTLHGAPIEGEPLVITLGTQVFTVAADLFTAKKPGVYSCRNAVTVEGNGIITATLDVNKCTFAILLKNANVEAEGISDFSLAALGRALAALVDLGTTYTYWDLTLYDQPGKDWLYDTRCGNTEVTVHDNGINSFEIHENECDAAASLYYAKEADNAAEFQRLEIDSADLGGEISLNLGVAVWPSQLRLGQTWLAVSSLEGEMHALGYTAGITNGTTSSKTVVSPKTARVKVPAGTYDTVKYVQTWTLKGALQFEGEVVGKITFVITQTDNAAPGAGVVKRVRRFTCHATVYGAGTISDSFSETYVLSD